MTEEKATQKAVIEYLEYKHYFYWRNNTGAMKTEAGGFYRFGAVGSPDIFVFHRGIFYGLEIKGSKGKMSAGQVVWQQQMEKNFGVYKVIRSLDDLVALGL